MLLQIRRGTTTADNKGELTNYSSLRKRKEGFIYN